MNRPGIPSCAALAYVEEATQTKHVGDETFAALRRHFDDEQIVTITWLNAVENYFNLLDGPLGIDSACVRSPSTAPASPTRECLAALIERAQRLRSREGGTPALGGRIELQPDTHG